MIFTALVMELYSEQVVEYNEVIRTISSLFIFLRTVFERKKKAPKRKTKVFQVFVRIKNVVFVVQCLFNFIFLVDFCLYFFTPKPFRKKINKLINRLEIVLMASLYYTTDVYSYQPAHREFICTHLFLFVIICENLFFL